MKLVRFGEKNQEKPGLIDEQGVLRDLSAHTADFSHNALNLEHLARLRKINPHSLPAIVPMMRLGACIADAPNFHCIGLNYTRHAKESGMAIPKEPILFSKSTATIAGPFDPVQLPRNSVHSDWEVELGVVIGAACYEVSKKDALEKVAGYCVINDLSERYAQLHRGGQWVKGKSAPGFAPIGPWLVTGDEIPDPQNLALWLELNGQTMQKSNTADMIFSVAEIIAYMSKFMLLRIGDVIATGTPSGVGLGLKPPRYLKSGDQMRLGVDQLSEQSQTVL